MCTTVSDYLKNVTVLDEIGWLVKAWKIVHTEMTHQCFAKCSYTEESCTDDMDNNETEHYAHFQEQFCLVDSAAHTFLDQGIHIHDSDADMPCGNIAPL